MADNVTLNSMSGGDVVGADEISGIKYQRVKLIHGADGTNDGDVSSTNGLPTVLKEYIAGEDATADVMKVEQRYSNFNISTATTTTVFSGQGFLHELICVGGTLGNVTVYDNTAASGTVLCPAAQPAQGAVILRDISISVGLTIVTAAATVLTGSYRQ
mgnify:CR=1 FL=1